MRLHGQLVRVSLPLGRTEGVLEVVDQYTTHYVSAPRAEILEALRDMDAGVIEFSQLDVYARRTRVAGTLRGANYEELEGWPEDGPDYVIPKSELNFYEDEDDDRADERWWDEFEYDPQPTAEIEEQTTPEEDAAVREFVASGRIYDEDNAPYDYEMPLYSHEVMY